MLVMRMDLHESEQGGRVETMGTELVAVECGELMAAEVQPQDHNPALVYLARLAPSGRRTMGQALQTLAAMVSGGQIPADRFPWAALTYAHAAALRARLAERYSPATVNKCLAALRGVLREAWQLGQMTAESYQRAAAVPNLKGSTLPRGRALASGELRALVDVCAADASSAGPRDAALLALLYGCGLRRQEAAALDLGDVDLQTGAVKVRAGKGRKDRLTYLEGGALEAVQAWADARGVGAGPFLCPVSKAGRVTARRMTAQALYLALRKRARAAGVPSFSPHDLRRTFVSDLLDAGADIVAVQHLAGHAQVTTTARYDRRGETAKRRAAALLHLPYHRSAA